MPSSGKGLEGVIAAETALSDIDGKQGLLFYVGYDIHDLAPNATFEEVVYLLHHLELPNAQQLEDIREQIGTEREPNDLVRRLVPPDPALSQAANFLWMLKGEKADDETARMFDMCLVLHADHTMNASTFAARVCAATLSDIHSSMTAAIAALKGPLHGGANEAVMRMIKEIKEPANARDYILNKLKNKEKVMGFGHRVYKTEDPRATHLRQMAKNLAEKTGDGYNYDISLEIEKAMMDEKGIYPNVDF